MTIRTLIEQLEKLVNDVGENAPVRVVDAEGEWPFSIHAEPELFTEGSVMVVCLDITGDPD